MRFGVRRSKGRLIATAGVSARRCNRRHGGGVGLADSADARADVAQTMHLTRRSLDTTGWIKRLGRNWARLHKLVYAIAVLAVLHFWWLVKSDLREPALYAGIAMVLLGFRIWKRWRLRTSLSARA